MTQPNDKSNREAGRWTRRDVLKAAATGALAAAGGSAFAAPTPARNAKPNFLFVVTDQQGLDTLSALGCRDVQTPNLDRLARRGTAFLESYSTNPLCSPARSSMFTGRPTLETGVVVNGRPIRSTMPNMGQWLRRSGYETLYAGKWHLPQSFTPNIPGFDVIATGINGQGGVCDASVSRACQGYLRNRSSDKPFLLVASFLQPHDVCQFVSMHAASGEMLFHDAVADELPPLPPNFKYDAREPLKVRRRTRPRWSEKQWRYYLWNYYRMVEMVDAEIGRVLRALEDSGQAGSTVVIFTADHGEGRARHQLVTKNYLYDEAAKVPLVVSCPGRVGQGATDAAHLVSGLDILPTICDYAGVGPPENVRGRSLRPLLEGGNVSWREFVPAEVAITGRMIRTPKYKYIAYKNDPVEQLFDVQADAGETKNLAGEAKHASALKDHRKLLAGWESRLDVARVALPKWAQPAKAGGGRSGRGAS